MTLRPLALALLALVLLMPRSEAYAQRAERPVATVESASGATAQVSVENVLEFPVKVVSVRLAFRNDEGGRDLYFSQPNWSIDLAPAGEEGASWTGELTFHAEGGGDVPAGLALGDNDSELVAAGVNIAEVAGAAESALQGGQIDAVLGQLNLMRTYVPPVSISSRHFPEAIAASGVDASAWFDFERLDGLKTQLQEAVCEHASQRILDASSQRRRHEVYEELVTWIREEADLHLSCMNEEAKLATARMLIASERPQDALGFSVRNEDGSIPEAWIPIYIEAHLALARAALEMDAETFATFERVLDSLHRVKEMDPDNEALVEVSAGIIPRACAWVEIANQRGDHDDVLTIMTLLRADWPEQADVLRVSDLVARSLLDSGRSWANRGMYVNARNEFVRGERLFQGIPVWEAERDTINHYRALGVLEEARETADLHTDTDAPERGLARLEEAQQMFPLSEQEVTDFQAYIAQSLVEVALLELDDFAFPMAQSLLERAEEVSPTGRTDAMREAWLLYAEQRYAKGGFFMTGADIEDARAKLALADDVDPDRASAIAGKLTMAYYGYRIGIPGLAVLFALLAGLMTLMGKRKAKKFEEMDLD